MTESEGKSDREREGSVEREREIRTEQRDSEIKSVRERVRERKRIV